MGRQGHIFCQCRRYLLHDRHWGCIINIMWAILWCKTVSNAWCTHTEIYGCTNADGYSNFYHLGIRRTNLHNILTGFGDLQRSWKQIITSIFPYSILQCQIRFLLSQNNRLH
ncbi:hypothetical protein R6Q59_034079 [Mikania micrantha]